MGKAAMPAYYTYCRLETEIPKLDAEIESITAKLNEANEELEQVLPRSHPLILAANCCE